MEGGKAMATSGLKVGVVAKRTGLTVRTLHHYDDLGLLSPSRRTESGHRLYTAGDLARLHQIMSLRQLGLSLEDIRSCLERPELSLVRVIELQIARLREQIEAQLELCRRLEAIAASLRSTGDVSVETLMQTM